MKDGGFAFPFEETGTTSTNPGMALRDYFADSALKGILSSPYWNEHGPFDAKSIAEAAWEYADAMLRAREETSGE